MKNYLFEAPNTLAVLTQDFMHHPWFVDAALSIVASSPDEPKYVTDAKLSDMLYSMVECEMEEIDDATPVEIAKASEALTDKVCALIEAISDDNIRDVLPEHIRQTVADFDESDYAYALRFQVYDNETVMVSVPENPAEAEETGITYITGGF